MLSRAAERIYWTGRYLERAECTARIVQQYTQLLLDLPVASGVDWRELPKIFGATFDETSTSVESGVMAILLSRPASPTSLRYCIAAVRNNVRNTRDLLPAEVWESVNELHAFAGAQLDSSSREEDRFEVLAECIARCQQVDGALGSTMSEHAPLHLMRLGQHLERADMTTRVIDVAADYLSERGPDFARFSATLWTNTLQALSALQMYRQYAQVTVDGQAVIRFLIDDPYFPRAIRHSLNAGITRAQQLPNPADVVDALSTPLNMLSESSIATQTASDVSHSMDQIQRSLGAAHQVIARTWFPALAA